MPIATNVVSMNPVDGEVYSLQHYVIKFVSNLQQVDVYLWVLRFPPPIKPTTTIMALNTITLNQPVMMNILISELHV